MDVQGEVDSATTLEDVPMNKLRLFAIVMIGFLASERSSACSCQPTSLREQFDRASIVFVATVIESKMGEPSIEQYRPADVKVTARFRVERHIYLPESLSRVTGT